MICGRTSESLQDGSETSCDVWFGDGVTEKKGQPQQHKKTNVSCISCKLVVSMFFVTANVSRSGGPTVAFVFKSKKPKNACKNIVTEKKILD